MQLGKKNIIELKLEQRQQTFLAPIETAKVPKNVLRKIMRICNTIENVSSYLPFRQH